MRSYQLYYNPYTQKIETLENVAALKSIVQSLKGNHSLERFLGEPTITHILGSVSAKLYKWWSGKVHLMAHLNYHYLSRIFYFRWSCKVRTGYRKHRNLTYIRTKWGWNGSRIFFSFLEVIFNIFYWNFLIDIESLISKKKFWSVKLATDVILLRIISTWLTLLNFINFVCQRSLSELRMRWYLK